MAITYEESKALAAALTGQQPEAAVMTAAAQNEQAYRRSDKYLWYENYRDDKLSYIDENKSIRVDASQLNLTQEANSQYIPFEMNRYYDGIDLMGMALQIHYVNSAKEEDYAVPINVEYSDDKIRFGWLVSANATYLAGDLSFELLAVGTNERGDNYIWKTRPNGRLNVAESLAGNGMVEPTQDWYTSFVTEMDAKVGEAMRQANEAKAAALSAQQSAGAVDRVMDSALSTLEDKLDLALGDYYTAVQVDSIKAALLKQMEAINGMENFAVGYDEDTRVLKFYNGDVVIKSIMLATDPTQEWIGAYNLVVDGKIKTAADALQQDLTAYKQGNDAAVKELQDSVGDLPQTLQSDYYTKDKVDDKLQDKADASALQTVSNDLAIIKGTTAALQSGMDGVNDDIAALNEAIAGIEPGGGNEYEATYQDNVFTLLENGEVKNQFTIEGGGGGGSTTSTVTIERVTPSAVTAVSGDAVEIVYNFTSVDNAGDDTGSGTAVWLVGSTQVAASTAVQGENRFDITAYLNSGDNVVNLRITDSFGTVSTKKWTVNLVEFYLESGFDDALFYSGDVVVRYTPYGSVTKNVRFVLDGTAIGGESVASTGRQMSFTVPKQSHGAHLLEVSMTAEINGRTVTSNRIVKDIIWIEQGNTTPVIGCAQRTLQVKQYSAGALRYVVYDPASAVTTVRLFEDGVQASALQADRTAQIWSYKSSAVGEHLLEIVCGEVRKKVNATVEKISIDIQPVTTNLALDFNPAGRTNSDEQRLWSDGKHSMTVNDGFDWTNGGYRLDEDGDTYFCVKAGSRAVLDYKLFEDDAKKSGKNFKLIFKTANVKDYDAEVLQCLNGGIGLQVKAQNANLYSEQNSMQAQYCEDSYLELEFNVRPDSEYREMLLYMSTDPIRAQLYGESDSFTQPAPADITIGSDNCDVHIYRLKAYTMNLTDDEIIDNFIADAKNAEEMVARYERNDILNVSGELAPDLLAEKCPDLRVIKISAPRFTAGKKNEIADCVFQQIYKNGRELDNWTAQGSHKGQGTSSDGYGESARNIDLNCSGGFVFADGSTGAKYAMTAGSMPEKYFNIKVNVASSENANNACLADDYNTFNPYLRAARQADARVRDTMEFHPCVIFVQETDIANSTVFHDGQWHFYACGDFGNSKKNKDTMGMNPENHKEFIVEVGNNTDPQTRFLSDDLSGETWDGDNSFEFRYENPDCTEQELQAGKDAWQRVLSWVVNADEQTFKAEFEDYFIKDSLLYFYLYTLRNTMIDNRAKNTFFHTEDLVHWDVCFDYDNDTALGNDNEGGLSFTYGLEDTDTIGTKSVFNASDSKLWRCIREYMQDDLAAMYIRLEGSLAWSAQRKLKKFEDYQRVKPERLVMMDMRRKYLRPYEENGTVSYLPMMLGSKKQQREQFEKYQEPYMASKFVGTSCTTDRLTIRGYTPVNWSGVQPDGTLRIKPYADTYIVCRYGSNMVQMRAKRGQTYTVQSPVEAMNDTEVYIYNAGMLQSIGDISGFYPGYVDFGMGVKLTDLQIGSSVEGYANTNMTDFAIGSNKLLETLNLENVPNLKKSISLAGCTNLDEFYAQGSGITGVVFANGGKIRIAHLPEIASLTAKNLTNLVELNLASHANITTLVVENCAGIDLVKITEQAVRLNRVRFCGIDWTLRDTGLLDLLLGFGGVDENGYNVANSVLSGRVFVPVMREQKLLQYKNQWPDLELAYNTLVNQFAVTFKNADGTVLEVQYVDKGEKPVDPVTRETAPIAVPRLESTVSTQYTYAGWDTDFAAIFEPVTITAVYTETTREYTVRFLNRGNILQTTRAKYGSSVQYEGEMPSYTAEESAYKYYLFTGWSQGGFVDGDKDIEAVYDSFEYSAGCFDGRELGQMRAVEIYAMTKTGSETSVVQSKDSIAFTLGSDCHYEDIEEQVLVAQPIAFNGGNYLDTGVTLFDKDRDFVLAIDFAFAGGNTNGSVLAQCYESNGMNGLRLWYNNGPKVSWATVSAVASGINDRQMVVVRHIKGEKDLYIYNSNTGGQALRSEILNSSRAVNTQASLVFGCAKADDGAYENHARGSVYWAKVWYGDLGEQVCRELAVWPHAQMEFEMAGFKKYYLSDNASRRCSMSFIAKRVLSQVMQMSGDSRNEGGWAKAALNAYLNSRLYEAIPTQWKQLMKKVSVLSSAGSGSAEMSSSGCYLYVPSLTELDPTVTAEPYCYEGTAIDFMTTNENRIARNDAGDAAAYWTRSPNAEYSSYMYEINESGIAYGFIYPSDMVGVRIMFSI